MNPLSSYSVGMATADITPPVGTPLAGYSARGFHSSTGVYHPLRAVAMAIDDGTTSVLLVSVEWIGFDDLAGRVRERLSQATGIPPAQIILAGTHTHCGPAIRRKDAALFGWIDHDYLNASLETVATIARRAMAFRRPATLKFATAQGSLAMNRRRPDPAHPGKVLRAIRPHPEGVTDPEISILVIESDAMIRGILFSYACHPTSRDGLWIGGDYPAFACDHLQEAFRDAQTMFLLGCAGDQRPRPVDPANDLFGTRTVEEVREAGFALGRSIERALRENRLTPVTGAITLRRQMLGLRTEPLDRQAVQAALADPAAPVHLQKWALHHQNRIEQGLPEERDVPFEIQTLRFGDSLAVVTLSAEMVVEYGLRLKTDLRPHFTHVLPLAYTNSLVGYIPVRRQFSEGGYEVLDANLHRRRTGRYVPETEDQIHAAVHALLETGS